MSVQDMRLLQGEVAGLRKAAEFIQARMETATSDQRAVLVGILGDLAEHGEIVGGQAVLIATSMGIEPEEAL